MMESAFSIYCPRCNSKNWLNNGDTSDLTQPDIEACKCWKCGKIFWLDGVLDIRQTMGEKIPESLDDDCDVYVEEGMETLR